MKVRKKSLYKPSKDELITIIDKTSCISEALGMLNIPNSRLYYAYFRDWVAEYGIELKFGVKYRHKGGVEPFDDSRIFCINGAHLSGNRLKERLFKRGYKKPQCEMCGIDSWRNEPISLQIHHINGNHRDNRLENLQILCPNCHSQTDNYAGKDKNKY